MHQASRVTEITAAQREAVGEAMRAILEDDLQRPESRIYFSCAGCGESRGGAGSIDYDGIRLCHECATEYELARVSSLVRLPSEFVAMFTPARPAQT